MRRRHRRRAPGRSGRAGRAPHVAVRAAQRGCRGRRVRGPADRRRAVRAEAVPDPEHPGRRGRHPGPGARRPGPGQRGDRGAGGRDRRPRQPRRRPRPGGGRERSGRPGGPRPAGRRGARRHEHPAVRPQRARRTDLLRPAEPAGLDVRRPGRGDRDAGDRPRRRGGLLRFARAAGDGADADIHRHLPHPSGLAGAAGRLVLPRIQPAHAAQPDGARGDAGPLPAAPALPQVQRLRHGDPGGAAVRLIRGRLGGLRRAGHGGARLSRRRRSARRPDAAAQDAAPHDHQRHPGRPGARARHDRSRGHGADDRARIPGGWRGCRQMAPRPAHLGPAVHLLRRVHRSRRPGR